MNIKTNVLPIIRKSCIGTAVVAGALTLASLARTPGTSLNPNGERSKIEFVEKMFPHKARSFDYNENESIVDNTKQAVTVAKNNLYDKVIDPITENPVIPSTATALAMLGVGLTHKKESETNVDAKENNIASK